MFLSVDVFDDIVIVDVNKFLFVLMNLYDVICFFNSSYFKSYVSNVVVEYRFVRVCDLFLYVFMNVCMFM